MAALETKVLPLDHLTGGAQMMAQIYQMAGIPLGEDVQGMALPPKTRYLIHPALQFGRWATLRKAAGDKGSIPMGVPSSFRPHARPADRVFEGRRGQDDDGRRGEPEWQEGPRHGKDSGGGT